jgi:hypothetical protein
MEGIILIPVTSKGKELNHNDDDDDDDDTKLKEVHTKYN